MTSSGTQRAAGTRSSVVVDRCQSCDHGQLEPVFFAGYLPPVNAMRRIGSRPHEDASYPAQLLRCPRCELVQLGLIVDPAILFPPDYPYTSGTTRLLRDNFTELCREASGLMKLDPSTLVVDIGSNDGTLLSNFRAAGARVRGIEPTDTGKIAQANGITTLIAFFGPDAVATVLKEDGPAHLITAANVFAHMEDIHGILESIMQLLRPDGLFVSESHYWISLLDRVQYDTIYHEHLRYYSLTSLAKLLRPHGLEIVRAKRIPTHGGSIRVYAARIGTKPIDASVAALMAEETLRQNEEARTRFRRAVTGSKLGLYELVVRAYERHQRIQGVSAPSRATTLINYVGLDETVLERVLEVPTSHKVGRYVPGTLIPVVDETGLLEDPPEHLLILSWHIADELIERLRARGFRGSFIVPLPEPHAIGPLR